MSDMLRQLTSQVEEACSDPRYARLKSMWTRHNRGEKVEKVPINVFMHRGYTELWKELIPPEVLVSTVPLERDIELQLRQKLYRHQHIPDDFVLMPTIWVEPVRPSGEGRLWGVSLTHRTTDDPRGSYAFEPVVQSEADLARLHYPQYQWDQQATQSLLEQVMELTGGRLPVKTLTDEIRANPAEKIVQFLGYEGFYYGLADNPKLIHALMDFLTEGSVQYHRDRQSQGVVDPEESWWFRVNYEHLPANLPQNNLAACWVYVSAQTTGQISPSMYEEFVHPYNERLASIFGRVYYHGCEDLTAKMDVIQTLPNLRRFHVSPWTNLEVAAAKLGGKVVLETHVSPATTVVLNDPEQMRQDVQRIMEVAGDFPIDINLSDIETVQGDPTLLTTWARIAQEVASDGRR